MVERIVTAVAPELHQYFLEIGAGGGELTVPLARRAPRALLAVELDPVLVDRLRDALERAAVPTPVEVVQADILDLDLAKTLMSRGFQSTRVVGNLPYSVASSILVRLLTYRSLLHDMTLMFQQEVAQRLVAEPGSKAYGALSVVAQQAARIRPLFRISPEAFWPRPKVHSELLRFELRGGEEPPVGSDRLFRALVKALFSHRRKNISNNLKHLTSTSFDRQDVLDGLEALGIDPRSRAEALSVEQFAALSHFCASRR